uniref:LRAT domain-containing protein n=1 Tax=Parascaris univalens TaxID=6257 RepID=A0A915AJ55_PARUN
MSSLQEIIESEMRRVIIEAFDDDWLWKEHVTTSLGQHLCVFARRTFGGRISLYLLSNDERLTPPVCKPIKVANIRADVSNAKAIASRFCDSMRQTPIVFDFTSQPKGISVPVDKESMRLVQLPGSALYYPDSFLEHGDEVLVRCKAFGFNFFHAGIYHRGGYVYHFMTTCDMTSFCGELGTVSRAEGAVLFDRWTDFIYALNEPGSKPTLCLLSHVLRVRSGEEIVNCARALYFNHSQFVEYDIRDRNCQHFASYCARGVLFSFEMASNLRYLACSLIKPSNVILGSLHKIGSVH